MLFYFVESLTLCVVHFEIDPNEDCHNLFNSVMYDYFVILLLIGKIIDPLLISFLVVCPFHKILFL